MCVWGGGVGLGVGVGEEGRKKEEREGGRGMECVRVKGGRKARPSATLLLFPCLVQFVYVSVRGLASRNTFTIIIWDMIFNEDQYTVEVMEGVRDTQIFNLVGELKITNVT